MSDDSKVARIMQDPISNAFLILALMIMVYFTFVLGNLSILIYPFILLIAALTFRVFINKKLVKDTDIDKTERKDILIYYFVGLIGIGIGNLLVKGLYTFPINEALNRLGVQITMSMAPIDDRLFTILMAIVEEQLFRGEMLEWMSGSMPPGVASLANAGVFSVYHLGVYGTQPQNLIYVLVGGIALAWITIKSRRLTSALGAHITNNILGAI